MADWASKRAKEVVHDWFRSRQSIDTFNFEDSVARALREARAEGMAKAAEICDAAEALHMKDGDPTSAATAGQCSAMIRERAGEDVSK